MLCCSPLQKGFPGTLGHEQRIEGGAERWALERTTLLSGSFGVVRQHEAWVKAGDEILPEVVEQSVTLRAPGLKVRQPRRELLPGVPEHDVARLSGGSMMKAKFMPDVLKGKLPRITVLGCGLVQPSARVVLGPMIHGHVSCAGANI